MSKLLDAKAEISAVPEGEGCLSVLATTEPGQPIQAFGNVPPKLIGAKWAAVHTWFVVYWRTGTAWASILKSDCGYHPPELWAVQNNFTAHPGRWQRLAVKQKGVAP